MNESRLRDNLREPIVLSAILLAYSNGLTAFARAQGKDPERTYLFANPLMLISLLYFASKKAWWARVPPGCEAMGWDGHS